jgi:hypothetical protein
LTEVDAWVTALLLALAMLAGYAAGWLWARHLGKDESEQPASKFSDAVMGLLGLLLAFTFSVSLVKHEQRRQMVVTDSNSIGDFYTCASLLKEPVRSKLQAVVRQYVEHRLSMVQSAPDQATSERMLDEIPQMHQQMQNLVGLAVDGGTPVVVPLVNTLNALTSAHAARLAAGRDRLQPSIALLLFLAAVAAVALMRIQQGATVERRFGATIGFIVLVCMIVWVTLDLNQPSRGVIRVSQEPLERLLTGMGK